VIKVGTLAKIRRLYLRDKLSINTVRSWLRESDMVEPMYPTRQVVTKLDNYADTLLARNVSMTLLHLAS
jgi:hypothetical protein